MEVHRVRVHPAAARLPREGQLAWKLAAFAGGAAARGVDPDVGRDGRLPRRRQRGGGPRRHRPGAGGRGAGHGDRPCAGGRGDARRASRRRSPSMRSGRRGRTARPSASSTSTTPSWPPTTRTPRTASRPWSPSPSRRASDGARLLAAIAAAYEVHMSLVKGDQPPRAEEGSRGPPGPRDRRRARRAAGSRGRRPSTRRSTRRCTSASPRASRERARSPPGRPRRPAWAGKLAIEAVDRAMRGEGAPNPIYEGEDGVIAWMLAGPDAEYAVPLPAPGERPAGSSRPTRRRTPPSTRRRP